MAVYRGGTTNITVGAPSDIQDLIDRLDDAVSDAEAAQTAAATSASNAETYWNNFNNLYLGTASSDPTTDNDGSALDGGELYYNTVDNRLYVYDSGTSSWEQLHGDFFKDGSVAMEGTLDMAGNHLLDYTESDSSPSSSSGAITFDIDVGNIFDVTLTENITSITFSNVPGTGCVNIVLVLTQDATGSRTVTWPASVKWHGGTAPTLTTTGNAVDIITMFTIDGGTTWYAFTSGQDMQ